MLGDAHGSAVPVLRIFALTLPLTFVGFYLNASIIVPLHAIRALLLAGAALCVVALGSTALLAPEHGALGTAWGVLAGHVAMLAILVPVSWRAVRGRAAEGGQGQPAQGYSCPTG
jgi:O-antigen/teichoic acid export membrane protein